MRRLQADPKGVDDAALSPKDETLALTFVSYVNKPINTRLQSAETVSWFK